MYREERALRVTVLPAPRTGRQRVVCTARMVAFCYGSPMPTHLSSLLWSLYVLQSRDLGGPGMGSGTMQFPSRCHTIGPLCSCPELTWHKKSPLPKIKAPCFKGTLPKHGFTASCHCVSCKHWRPLSQSHSLETPLASKGRKSKDRWWCWLILCQSWANLKASDFCVLG